MVIRSATTFVEYRTSGEICEWLRDKKPSMQDGIQQMLGLVINDRSSIEFLAAFAKIRAEREEIQVRQHDGSEYPDT